MTHGKEEEAERVTSEIEEAVEDDVGEEALEEPPDSDAIELRERRSIGFIELGRTLFKRYPRRSVVGFSLMGTQAFVYNTIFFTDGLILTTFYGVASDNVGWFMLPFAAGNFLGPLLLGRFFDTIGRRQLITTTYALAGALTIGLGFAFTQPWMGSVLMTVGWVVIFFFASAGASAGYLTVSETFPLEIRAMAIAFFYASATAAGGIVGPWLFGTLIGSGDDRGAVFLGYAIGGGLMLVGAGVELLWGVAAEQRGLEDIAQPLSAEAAEEAEGSEEAEETGPGTPGPSQEPERPPRPEPRHLHPYPARTMASGLWSGATFPAQDIDVDHEIDAISSALTEDGELSRAQLSARVDARRWGPGRLGHALDAAEREHRVQRSGRRYRRSEEMAGASAER